MNLNTDFYTKGGVHTASYFTEGEHRPNAVIREIFTDFQHGQKNFKMGTKFKYNPNKGVGGECTSLDAYSQLLGICVDSLSLNSPLNLMRIDFRVDCNIMQQNRYRYWRKLGEWAIACFIAKKKVRPKNEGRTLSLSTGEHESAHARTEGFQLVCYNKALQKKAEGVGYRFEIRRFIKGEENEQEALCKMRDLLRQLPLYAEQAQKQQNAKLLKLWHESAPKAGTPRMVNEFITAHVDDIYTKEQLRAFYELLGYPKEKALKAKNNYCASHTPVFLPVTAKDLEAFCEIAALYIENFIAPTDNGKRFIW